MCAGVDQRAGPRRNRGRGGERAGAGRLGALVRGHRRPPDDWSLPHPDSVPEGSGEFGNLLIQVVAGVQVLAGAALLVATAVTDLGTIVAPAMGIVFLLVGVFLFAMVANARLSDRFRSEEYRDRLRALREAKERPEFVPVEDGVVTDEEGAATDRDRNE